ncbi:hypothetical protein F3Y22_tig00112738pilonHSYRG01195 [Hibiscus syriacus]|uniref:Uncharacterized protein n=1 Tax=Hibiscus syriacus TaxID=106335 RepID=A0A6A2WUS1_HIBSY|nr:hypothetical protein F3Y22_tig00112738pilonHSYRG01195 [Hibiscus syriacus]
MLMTTLKRQCTEVAEIPVCGGAHEPKLEDRLRSLQIGVDRFAFAAWPMKGGGAISACSRGGGGGDGSSSVDK